MRMVIRKTKTYMRASTGASLVLALFFIMVCLILGSIALVASTTVVGRSAENIQDNQTTTNTQNMYSLECAVKLVASQIDNQVVFVSNSDSSYKYWNFYRDDEGNFVLTDTQSETSFADVWNTITDKNNNIDPIEPSSCDCILRYLVSQIYENKKSTYSTTVTLKNNDFGEISCKMTIDSTYNIIAILNNKSDTNSREIELVFNSTTESNAGTGMAVYWTLQ